MHTVKPSIEMISNPNISQDSTSVVVAAGAKPLDQILPPAATRRELGHSFPSIYIIIVRCCELGSANDALMVMLDLFTREVLGFAPRLSCNRT